MTNPYVLLAAVLLWIGTGVGAFFYGRNVGLDSAAADAADRAKLIAEVTKAAQDGAAKEIAKIKVINQTVNRRVETRTREVPVYRDCVHDPMVQRLLDDARAGRLSPDAVGDRVVSGSGASPP